MKILIAMRPGGPVYEGDVLDEPLRPTDTRAARTRRPAAGDPVPAGPDRAIAAMIPDAVILTPFRAPIDHAQSLLRQHLNYSEIHWKEALARDYMRSIGHLDFRANLKPVNFGGWVDRPRPASDTLDFWLMYWCAAFEHLLAHKDSRVNFISYDRLCADPVRGLSFVAQTAGIGRSSFVEGEASKYENRSKPEAPAGDPRLIDRARAIHEALLKVSIV